MKQVNTVILQQRWPVQFHKQTGLTMEHALAVAAETKASSGSFAMLEATMCKYCV